MGRINLRLPNSLFAQLKELARREGVSINQLITTAVAEKLSALMTEDYLAARAERGDRAAFERALARVRDGEPAPGDEP